MNNFSHDSIHHHHSSRSPPPQKKIISTSVRIKRFSKLPGHGRREFLILTHLIDSCLLAEARSPSSDVDYSSSVVNARIDLASTAIPCAARNVLRNARRRGASKTVGRERRGGEAMAISSPSSDLYVDAIVGTVHDDGDGGMSLVFVGRAFRSAGAASTRLGWWFFDDMRKCSNTYRGSRNANLSSPPPLPSHQPPLREDRLSLSPLPHP